MAEPDDPRTQAYYAELNAQEQGAPREPKWDDLSRKQKATLQKQVEDMHAMFEDPKYRKKKNLLEWLTKHPHPTLFVEAYKARWAGESPEQTFERVRAAAAAGKAAERGPVHELPPTSAPRSTPNPPPPLGGAPPGDGMDVAWYVFNKYVLDQVGLKTGTVFLPGQFDILQPDMQKLVWRLLKRARKKDRDLAKQIGISPLQCGIAAKAMWERAPSIRQFDPVKGSQGPPPSPRTQLKLEAERDQSLIDAGLKPPLPETGEQMPDDMKRSPKKIFGGKTFETWWNYFHLEVNSYTKRGGAAVDRPLTESEFWSEEFGPINRRIVIDVLHRALRGVADHRFRAMDDRTRRKIALKVLKRMPSVQKHYHL